MEPKKLYKSMKEKMLCGVCGGVAEYFNIDPTIIRLIVILAGCMSWGSVLIAYFIAAVIIPEK